MDLSYSSIFEKIRDIEQNIINDIASGIGMGMATVVVAFVGLVEVKNRFTKRRNKREDADQEKSDTE